MDDRTIKQLLVERSETALNEISIKYSKLYKGIIRDILNDESDVEECENDLLLALWSSIPPNDPESLSAYICTLSRRIGINRYKYNTRQKRGAGYTLIISELENCIPTSVGESAGLTQERSEHIKYILSDFIKGLDAETRVLFIRRYIFFESVKSLSERFDLKESAISVKLFRARNKLKKVLKKEGICI